MSAKRIGHKRLGNLCALAGNLVGLGILFRLLERRDLLDAFDLCQKVVKYRSQPLTIGQPVSLADERFALWRNRAIFRAASQASKAADYILAFAKARKPTP